MLGVEFGKFSATVAASALSPVGAWLHAIGGSAWRRIPLNQQQKSRLKHLAYRCAALLVGAPSPSSALSSQRLLEFDADGQSDELLRALNSKHPSFAHCATTALSRFMHFLWSSRPDLQWAFDITDSFGRMEFTKWYLVHARREYGLNAAAYPAYVLAPLLRSPEPGIRAAAEAMGTERAACACEQPKGEPPGSRANEARPAPGVWHRPPGRAGVNLIGYARGVFGMGQQLRAMATSCSEAAIPFSICNIDDQGHGSRDESVAAWITPTQDYACNIFNMNPDTLLGTYFRFGPDFFSQRHNIGYWAWELPRAPEEFDFAFSMVDELWAVSRFVEQALSARSPVPVVHMPLPIVVPAAAGSYGKARYGQPEDCFVFLFVFDAASYLVRKNPIAAVRAFMQAFPDKHTRVRLVLKTMNVREDDESWKCLVREAKRDPRISILTTRMTREELLGLMGACDVFVSLHRSEGFALCIAESMWLGKPVISTNFSGSRDFAREGTACTVDYMMCPVEPGAYPFAKLQHWAEPSIEHASWYMRRLLEDEGYRDQISKAGQAVVQATLNPAVVGQRYAARLAEIGLVEPACRPS